MMFKGMTIQNLLMSLSPPGNTFFRSSEIWFDTWNLGVFTNGDETRFTETLFGQTGD